MERQDQAKKSRREKNTVLPTVSLSYKYLKSLFEFQYKCPGFLMNLNKISTYLTLLAMAKTVGGFYLPESLAPSSADTLRIRLYINSNIFNLLLLP